jgi:ribosome-binding protein aMBF1 (putative translation factor)
VGVLEDKSILTNGKGHMRTQKEIKEEQLKENKQLISEIKRVCEQLGLSQKELAKKIYLELNNDDNEKGIKAFSSAFAKQLQRPTTQQKKLEEYLSIISRLPEFKKSDLVRNEYIPLGHLSDLMQNEMLKISNELDKKFRDKEIEEGWEE